MRRLSARAWAVVIGLVLAAALSLSPVVDQRAEGNYASLFQRALVTFALARTLNGVISVVQGTELALQPAGVGLTLTPGEILDPVNDLVERFSWIMLGATVSLGIQQVLLEVSAWWLLKGVAAVLALSLALVHLFSHAPGDRPRRVLARVFLVALFLRFAVPLTLIANDLIYQQFLHQRYASAATVISDASDEISRIGDTEPPAGSEQGQGGLLGSLGKAMDNTRQALDLGDRVERIKVRAAQMIEHLIELSVVFVLQTAILPLAFLWLFLQGIKWALSNRIHK
jgi:hypothetical protein